jgi:tRNA G10  N-methylase Trm11
MTDSLVLGAPHPAKYSAPIVHELARLLTKHVPTGPLLPPTVLDPFAGVGGVHVFGAAGYSTVGVEIEPRWAAAHPGTIVGDATRLPFDAWRFDAAVTSPTYGNRLADTYDGGRDTCKACAGNGTVFCADDDDIGDACDVCHGSGFKSSKRYTYRTYLGEPLAANNAGGMQWGPAYRTLHRLAWHELARVLKPGGVFLLNISDHVRGGRLQGVDLWHAACCAAVGFELIEQVPVTTQRSRNGANSELRDLVEWILVFKNGPTR